MFQLVASNAVFSYLLTFRIYVEKWTILKYFSYELFVNFNTKSEEVYN